MSTVSESVTDCVLQISDRELWCRLQSPSGPGSRRQLTFSSRPWPMLGSSGPGHQLWPVWPDTWAEPLGAKNLADMWCDVDIWSLLVCIHNVEPESIQQKWIVWWDDHRLSRAKQQAFMEIICPMIINSQMWMRGNKKSVGILQTEDSFRRINLPNAQHSGIDENAGYLQNKFYCPIKVNTV